MKSWHWLAMGALCTGCAPGYVGVAQQGSAESRSTAMLFVERRASETASSSAQLGGRFVQFHGMTADALPDLLGMPHAADSTAEGCQERSNSVGDVGATQSEVRLMDVGTLQVQAGERTLSLQPRRFPELWNVVSGVIYAADEDLPSERWRFTGSGSADGRVAGFDVEAQAPEALASVTLDAHAWTPGAALSLTHRAFTLRWAHGDGDDRVVLSVESDTGTTSLVCTSRDEGALEIDAVWADRIAERVRTGSRMTLHRVRSRPFALAGFEQASVVFDWSLVSGPLTVE